MVTKIGGILLLVLGIYIFKIGLKYDDSNSGHLMNVKLIGSAVLLVIGGIALALTNKTMCEIFGVLC